MFKTSLKAAFVSAAVAMGSGAALAPLAAHANPMVGGAAMHADKNIVQNAVNSPVHKTLVAAVKQAGLVKTLEGPGPFTVFAPTDKAFAKLPKGTVASLMKPANKQKLASILTYHVVPGKHTGPELLMEAKKHGGKYMLKTVNGEALTVEPYGKGIAVVDKKGDKAVVTTADVDQSNGVIHVVNRVLLP